MDKFFSKQLTFQWVETAPPYLPLMRSGTELSQFLRIFLPTFAYVFLDGYEAGFIQGLLKACKKHLAQIFNYTCRYIDDVLALNNSKISAFIDLICLCELKGKIRQNAIHLPYT